MPLVFAFFAAPVALGELIKIQKIKNSSISICLDLDPLLSLASPRSATRVSRVAPAVYVHARFNVLQ